MNDLKPCPFCGGEADLIKREYGDNTGYATVLCKGCGNMTQQFYKSLDLCAVDEAIKSWNRRATKSIADAPQTERGGE